MLQNTTRFVSRASIPAEAGADRRWGEPSLSADGHVVAFTSYALTWGCCGRPTFFGRIFVRDLAAGTALSVSRATGADGAAADATSSQPAVSANGRFVAYTSEATNLSGDDTDAHSDVYVRDLQTDTTVLASRATGTDGPAHSPSISADGRYVAFRADGHNPDGTESYTIFVRDLQLSTTTLIGAGWEPSISADGHTVAFSSIDHALLQNGDFRTSGVLVRNVQTGALTLASRENGAYGAIADSGVGTAALSADGRFVAFVSRASNLLPAGALAVSNVFVRDLQTNTTRYVSRRSGPNGAGADSHSYEIAISADANFVAFQSEADNLTDEDDPDAPYTSNVFVRQLVDGNFSLSVPPALSAPASVDEPVGAPAPQVAPTAATGDTTAPRITGLALAPRSFRVSRAHGRAATAISLRLSERATIEGTVERLHRGRRANGRCTLPSRARRGAARCTRFVRVGTAFTRRARAGLNRFAFDGRLRGRTLAPGRYRLRVTARDTAGNTSPPSHITFRVTR
jgi:Tol biopolymer transport system component